MAGVPLTLTELIDSATSIHNRENNDVYAGYVSKQVNKEINGPQTAAKLLIEKLQLHQEMITLQTLNVIERCAKDCGLKFHQEIGKYKFINELIKLLSPKYDGGITPQSIKDRIIELLFSWYIGLPQEKKIGEAYKMLKQQGIIKRDPIDLNKPGECLPKYNEKTVFSDEGNSELLKTLLSSKNPDDLQSANKLIKSLVKEEEARLERVSKRIQDLELVSNNVRLLDDMLSHYNLATPQPELDLLKELYESCLQMRPELFRLASNSAQDKDDSMAEILCASDELTRVIDLYKEKVLLQKIESNLTKPYNIQTATGEEKPVSESLLDLGFGSPNTSQPPPYDFSGESLLEEQFKELGLNMTDATSNQKLSSATIPPYYQTIATQGNNGVQQFSQHQFLQQQCFHQQSLQNSFRNQPPYYFPASASAVSSYNMSAIGVIRPPVVMMPPTKAQESSTELKNKVLLTHQNDLLDFDVFSEFREPKLPKPKTSVQHNLDFSEDKLDGANQSAIDFLLDIQVPQDQSDTTVTNILSDSYSKRNESTFLYTPTPTILQNSLAASQSIHQPQTTASLETVSNILNHNPSIDSSPNNMQVNYLVPLEALKSAGHAPIVILDKDSLKTFLNIVLDTREGANPNVLVFVLSTVSTSTRPTSNFSVQVAVPKTMRVKLQPATSTDLPAFNPIFPPPTITQIMLIANPAKEKVRLRLKILYSMDGISYVENFNIDELPVK